jgi:hypothetical protein
MSDKMKTTVYLEAAEYRRVKALARSRGQSAAELIRLAVSEYTARHGGPDLPMSFGIARSGDGTLSERSEDLLEGLGRS